MATRVSIAMAMVCTVVLVPLALAQGRETEPSLPDPPRLDRPSRHCFLPGAPPTNAPQRRIASEEEIADAEKAAAGLSAAGDHAAACAAWRKLMRSTPPNHASHRRAMEELRRSRTVLADGWAAQAAAELACGEWFAAARLVRRALALEPRHRAALEVCARMWDQLAAADSADARQPARRVAHAWLRYRQLHALRPGHPLLSDLASVMRAAGQEVLPLDEDGDVRVEPQSVQSTQCIR